MLASIVSFFLLLAGFIAAHHQHMESIETYAKEVRYYQIYLDECQQNIAFMEEKCARHNVKVNDLISAETYLCRINFDDLKELKAELAKEEKILYTVQERYLRSIADKEDNIESISVDNGLAKISYYQVVDYDGSLKDELLVSEEMDLRKAIAAVENGMFHYGKFIMYRQMRTIKTDVRLEGAL